MENIHGAIKMSLLSVASTKVVATGGMVLWRVWAVAEKDTLSNRDALVNGTVLIPYITSSLVPCPLS